MISHKANQLDQGLRGEQRRGRLLSRAKGWHRREVRPVPGQGEQEAILTAENDPGFCFPPEDPADASSLPAGGTLLSQDPGLCSLKCKIWCGLFGG